MSTNTSHSSNDNSQEPLLKQKLDLYRKDLKRGLDLIIDQEAVQTVYDENKKVLYVPATSVHSLLDTFAETLDKDLLTPSIYSLGVLQDLATHLNEKFPEPSLVSNFLDPEWMMEVAKMREMFNTVLSELSTPSEADANNDVLKVFHKTHQMLLLTYLTQTKELDSLKECLTQTKNELEFYKQRERKIRALLAGDTSSSAGNISKMVCSHHPV